MKTIIKILGIFIAIILVLLVIYGISLDAISNLKCKDICREEGALTYDIISSGSWKLYDDFCICYFKDKVEVFNIREKISSAPFKEIYA